MNKIDAEFEELSKKGIIPSMSKVYAGVCSKESKDFLRETLFVQFKKLEDEKYAEKDKKEMTPIERSYTQLEIIMLLDHAVNEINALLVKNLIGTR